MLELTGTEASFRFDGLAARPVPSILRGFSAPVIVEREADDAERAFLLAHDPDPFRRWEAGRELARGALIRMATEGAAPEAALLDALARVAQADLDPAFRALCLALPGEDELAQAVHEAGGVPDPDAIHAAHEALTLALAAQARGPPAAAPARRATCPAPTTPAPRPRGAARSGRRRCGS